MKAGLFLAILLLGTARLGERVLDHSLSVLFFDVGQGDSAMIRFPNGKVWLVDGGGGFGDKDRGQRDLFLELTRLAILRIDVALLSHPDEDHAMGFRGIFQNLPVEQWWFHHKLQSPPFLRPVFNELKLLSLQREIANHAVTSERIGHENGARWRVIPLNTSSNKTNDQALLLELSYGRCEVLFTGDIEAEGERAANKVFHGPIEFLKVPHHGSKTSSSLSWISRLRPRLAIASLGFRNSYGHPHRAIVERYQSIGSRLLRTDRNGFVRLTMQGNGEYACEDFHGDCGKGTCD